MYHLCSCVCCREHPVFLIFMQLAVISIFKSYPTVGDVALYLAFLPVWSHLHRCEWGGGPDNISTQSLCSYRSWLKYHHIKKMF